MEEEEKKGRERECVCVSEREREREWVFCGRVGSSEVFFCRDETHLSIIKPRIGVGVRTGERTRRNLCWRVLRRADHVLVHESETWRRTDT